MGGELPKHDDFRSSFTSVVLLLLLLQRQENKVLAGRVTSPGTECP